MSEPLKRHWITQATNVPPAMLLRKDFDLPRPVRKATLRISGLGYFVAWINGQRVGDHVLDPAQSDYEVRTFCVTHDVTGLLAQGKNTIGAELGDGWFNQTRVRIYCECIALAYGSPRLWAELHVIHDDGSETVMGTDKSWKTSSGATRENNVYAGETFDARLVQRGWNTPDFDASSWEDVAVAVVDIAPLEEQLIPPIRVCETMRPVDIRKLGEGHFVVDMGRNFAGWARIAPRAPRGTEIRLRFAEMLGRDGNVDTATTGVFATRVEQIDTYICSGEEAERNETWEPSFTYHGFRYVEVTGWHGELTADDITGCVVHTDLQPAGHFECSDERLNAAHCLAVWTHINNVHSVPEDCPARERCGWLGDANVVAQYSMWNFHGKEFWEKYLGDIETSRSRNKGLPFYIAPGKRTCDTGTSDWAVTLVLLPWYVYRHYGDASVLERHWEGMHFLMQHFGKVAKDWLLTDGIGDHCHPTETPNAKKTTIAITSNAWFFRCARVMRDTAKVLGLGGYADLYDSWAQCINAALVENFWRDGSFGSQTANAMALAFGFAPDAPAAAAALADDVRRRDMHHDCGIFGIRYLFEELTHSGYGDLALAVMRGDTYPSIGYMLKQGATTLWEWWEDAPDDGRVQGVPSLNHPMMGGYDNWFFNTLAGIEPLEPGFKKITLVPHPIAGLDWVRCYHDCPYGRIVSEWSVEQDVFIWKVVIPQGTTAMVTLPFSREVCELDAGEHTFTESTKK